jgi:hypothetical protein
MKAFCKLRSKINIRRLIKFKDNALGEHIFDDLSRKNIIKYNKFKHNIDLCNDTLNTEFNIEEHDEQHVYIYYEVPTGLNINFDGGYIGGYLPNLEIIYETYEYTIDFTTVNVVEKSKI